jgi:hypothetical protein
LDEEEDKLRRENRRLLHQCEDQAAEIIKLKARIREVLCHGVHWQRLPSNPALAAGG